MELPAGCFPPHRALGRYFTHYTYSKLMFPGAYTSCRASRLCDMVYPVSFHPSRIFLHPPLTLSVQYIRSLSSCAISMAVTVVLENEQAQWRLLVQYT